MLKTLLTLSFDFCMLNAHRLLKIVVLTKDKTENIYINSDKKITFQLFLNHVLFFLLLFLCSLSKKKKKVIAY